MRIRLALERAGHGHVWIDGIEISNYTRAVEMRASVGDPTCVTLDLIPELIELESTPEIVRMLRCATCEAAARAAAEAEGEPDE